MVKPVGPVGDGGGLHLFRNLAPGQVVRLQLVEPGLNGGIVGLDGRLFRAAGALPARPGEHFWAIVEKVQSDQITVRHLAPLEAGKPGLPAGELVRALGLPPGADTEVLLRELLRWRLPVDRELILRVLAMGRDLPQYGGKDLWPVLAWLQVLELPSRPGALAKIVAYVLGWDPDPEGQELLNQGRSRSGRDVVQALALNGGERLQGQVYLVFPGGGSELEAGVKVALHLRSGVFGEFWVSLEMDRTGLGGRLIIPEARWAARFQEAVPLLEDRLADLGYQVRPFTVETRRVGSVAELFAGAVGPVYVPLDIRV
ncbi:hypothetical protein [Candidatus Desulforudis audaxviator]|uniref:Flagellar hook-length control protein FliK n=1 Tax=Desulforudis audaxviator (strain MP104C) TaxID=477974 RepID=B1I5L4_DESAP|nr:hypothetical protein [Candidatus Desulforudis audaxviator]ACA60328.1 hypothetical protein Daud_1835 [Candidatus Desulforudis audaxviator MP104C]AZK60381.1 hypothetical protein Daudx_1849 [Candidatus Desulforudis audaxviator]